MEDLFIVDMVSKKVRSRLKKKSGTFIPIPIEEPLDKTTPHSISVCTPHTYDHKFQEDVTLEKALQASRKKCSSFFTAPPPSEKISSDDDSLLHKIHRGSTVKCFILNFFHPSRALLSSKSTP